MSIFDEEEKKKQEEQDALVEADRQKALASIKPDATPTAPAKQNYDSRSNLPKPKIAPQPTEPDNSAAERDYQLSKSGLRIAQPEKYESSGMGSSQKHMSMGDFNVRKILGDPTYAKKKKE